MRVFIYATHFVLILSCITLSDSSYDQVFPSENLLVQSQQWKRRAVTCLYMYILYIYIYIYIWVLGLAFHWRAHLLVWYKSLFNSLQKCQHCWLHKINVYHLETILELIIGHGQYRWHKPKRRGPKLILETPALAPVHEEACPFKVTLWFYLSNIQTKHWAVYRKFCHFVLV